MVQLLPVLKDLFRVLQKEQLIDPTDWSYVTHYAKKWKMSLADALLELNFLDETVLAKSLAKAYSLTYLPQDQLIYDFSLVTLENFDDLINVGAAPLIDDKLAICNPQDDHHGYLDRKFCEREMVVSERSGIIQALRKYILNNEEDDFGR